MEKDFREGNEPPGIESDSEVVTGDEPIEETLRRNLLNVVDWKKNPSPEEEARIG